MLPGLIVLVPAAIGMRGNVFGALGSRLGTQIHAGTFRLSRRDRHRGRPEHGRGDGVVDRRSRRCSRCSPRSMFETFGHGPSISIADFMVVSVVGAIISSVVVLVHHGRGRGVLREPRPRPRQRRGADRHRGGRHGDAAEPVPRDLPRSASTSSRRCIAIACVVARASARRSPRSGRTGCRSCAASCIESLPILALAGVGRRARGHDDREALRVVPHVPRAARPRARVPRGLGLARRDPLGAGRRPSCTSARSARAGRSSRGVAEDIMLVYVYAIPVFVFLGLSSTIAAHIVGKASPGARADAGREPDRGIPRHDRGGRRRVLRRRRDLPVRPRPRQPRHPARDVEPRPPRRAVAYPGDRAPRA